jgi:hypothetical protein
MQVQRFRNQSVSEALEAVALVLPIMSERRLEGPRDRPVRRRVSLHAIGASVIVRAHGLPVESVGSPAEASCV